VLFLFEYAFSAKVAARLLFGDDKIVAALAQLGDQLLLPCFAKAS
jgi:hypothetical protein